MILTAREFTLHRTASKFLTRTDIKVEQHYDLMIEFAKLHVQEALKQANEKVIVKEEYQYDEYDNCILIAKIDRDSILNAYPLENIK